MAIAIGEEAPDFTLKDQDGNDVTLSSFRGKQERGARVLPVHLHRRLPGRALRASRRPRRSTSGPRCRCWHAAATAASRQKNGPTSRATPSPCWPTSGHTARWRRPTACSTRRSGAANRATFIIDKDGIVVDEFESENLGTPRAARRRTTPRSPSCRPDQSRRITVTTLPKIVTSSGSNAIGASRAFAGSSTTWPPLRV